MSIDAYRNILLMLMRVADKKMLYYEEKYNLKVPTKETFYVEDVLDFAKKKASLYAERKEFLKSQGHDVTKL